MAGIIKILGIVLFLGLIAAQGMNGDECSTSDLSVSQTQTGATIQSKPEWSVSIINNCSCVQEDVVLDCFYFQTVESLDPRVVTVSDNLCMVEVAVYQNSPVNFKYAWDHSFKITVVSSTVKCS